MGETTIDVTAGKKANNANYGKAGHFGATDNSVIKSVPLECITSTYNVRGVLPGLIETFPFIKLIKMALGTPESKAEFVTLVEEHENRVSELDPNAHTILDLAASLFDLGQIEPICVRQLGTSERRTTDTNEKMGQMKYGYAVIVGGRRTMATAYLHATGLLGVAEILAKQIVVTKAEALDISVAENMQRQPFTDAEIGEIVAAYRHPEVNEEGVTPLVTPWKDIVKKLRRSEPFLRSCYLLVRPDSEAPQDLLEKVQRGEITKSEAVSQSRKKRASSKPSLGDGGDRLFRTVRKALPVKDIEGLIDATPHDENDPVMVARITALAECLGSTYDAEMALSNTRLAKVAGQPATDAA